MQIRKAKLKDLPQCVKLLHLPEFVFTNKECLDLEDLEVYLDSGLFFVAEENSKIIGCIFGEKMKGEIAMLWYFTIDKKRRGQGIGQKMISHFENECRKQEIEWILLYSPKENPRSSKFYRKMNYDKGKPYIEFNKEL